jgi:quercetin dioxygenase-like cupin family protein
MTANFRRALGVAALSLGAVFSAPQLFATDSKPAMTPPAASGKVSFVRLYTSADGNSHFSDETVELTPLNVPGAEGHLTAARLGDVKSAMLLSLKAGATEPYHIAPRRQIMFCLRGIAEVTAGDGEKRRVLPGQFVLLEDTSGKGHITHSAGKEDHVALAFPLPDDVLAKKP